MFGRRLFMKRAPAAPMAMDLLARSMTPDAVMAKTIQESAAMVAPNTDPASWTGPSGEAEKEEGTRLWQLFLRMAKKERDEEELITSRREFSGYCDPNILALRSISPAYKAMWLAREKMEREHKAKLRDEKYKSLSGYAAYLAANGKDNDD